MTMGGLSPRLLFAHLSKSATHVFVARVPALGRSRFFGVAQLTVPGPSRCPSKGQAIGQRHPGQGYYTLSHLG